MVRNGRRMLPKGKYEESSPAALRAAVTRAPAHRFRGRRPAERRPELERRSAGPLPGFEAAGPTLAPSDPRDSARRSRQRPRGELKGRGRTTVTRSVLRGGPVGSRPDSRANPRADGPNGSCLEVPGATKLGCTSAVADYFRGRPGGRGTRGVSRWPVRLSSL